MLEARDLSQFTGTMEYTKFSPFFPKMVMTDGAKHVALNGGRNGAFWLMDAIASHQPALTRKHPWARDAQFWKLTLDGKGGCVLECREDSGLDPAVAQKIEYTDFDQDEFELWVMPLGDGQHTVILLPSEY